MRPVLFLCVVIALLSGVSHCAEQRDHGKEDNPTSDDHHGKEHQEEEHHGEENHNTGHHDKEHHGQEHQGKEHNGQDHHGQEHHGQEHHGQEHHGQEHHGQEQHGKEHHDHKHQGEQHHDHGKSADINICHKVADANLDFAFNFYKHATKDVKSENVFFSPVSISTALAMLSLGAKASTLHQITKSLAFNLSDISEQDFHAGFYHLVHTLNNPKSALQLSMGNAIFIDENMKILPTYTKDVKVHYAAEPFSSNFKDSEEAKKQINKYVDEKTHGKIVDLIENLDQGTLMVLVNYIHFKGKWEIPFDSKLTSEDDFSVDEKTTVKVPMMRHYGRLNSFMDTELGCRVIQLNYAGNASALLVLPDKGKLEQVEHALSRATLDKWKRSVSSGIVNLHVPKFNVSATIDLKEPLQRMGMVDVFSDSADLSGITGDRSLKVSQAVHKTALSFDEEGTEAAGATAIGIMPVSFVSPITFNQPFLMLIAAEDSILFMGKVVNPTKV